MLSAHTVGGIALFLFVGTVFHPQIERALRSAWSRINRPLLHNESTSMESSHPPAAQPRTLFTTSQQNLKSKSTTSTKIDRLGQSQVDQLMASMADLNQTSLSPAGQGPTYPAAAAAVPNNPAGTIPAAKEPTAPSAPEPCRKDSQPDMNEPVKNSTPESDRTTRQPEVTSLFAGTPCAPLIDTFAPSIHGLTFCLTDPSTAVRDTNAVVDVNEFVAALAANPNLKNVCKSQDLSKSACKLGPFVQNQESFGSKKAESSTTFGSENNTEPT